MIVKYPFFAYHFQTWQTIFFNSGTSTSVHSYLLFAHSQWNSFILKEIKRKIPRVFPLEILRIHTTCWSQLCVLLLITKTSAYFREQGEIFLTYQLYEEREKKRWEESRRIRKHGRVMKYRCSRISFFVCLSSLSYAPSKRVAIFS